MQQRNNTVDAIRGIAMLMVVLQHTISGTTVGYENTFLFRAVWSLQMPLFFVISGYVTRYSKPVITFFGLAKTLRKRSLSYLLPWVVWTIAIRGILFGQKSFLDFQDLLWHMDKGYWFLVSLWTIVVIYAIADYLSNLCKRHSRMWSIILHLLFCGCGMTILGGIGYYCGIDFLSIKLTLYYIPLYLCGYIFGQLQDSINVRAKSFKVLPTIYGFAFGLWIFIILRINFYNAELSLEILILRYMASAFGCVALIGFVSNFYNALGGVFTAAGKYSLEIYLLHYLLLKPLSRIQLAELTSLRGFLTMTVEYALTIGMIVIILRIIIRNPILNKVLFYKTTSGVSSVALSSGPGKTH